MPRIKSLHRRSKKQLESLQLANVARCRKLQLKKLALQSSQIQIDPLTNNQQSEELDGTEAKDVNVHIPTNHRVDVVNVNSCEDLQKEIQATRAIDNESSTTVQQKQTNVQQNVCNTDGLSATVKPLTILPISFITPEEFLQKTHCRIQTNAPAPNVPFSSSTVPAKLTTSQLGKFFNTSSPKQRRCLLCYKKVENSSETNKASSISELHFQTMFVLKKLLNVSSSTLTGYLVLFGNPSGWIHFCKECKHLIDDAMAIQREIGRLEIKLKNRQELMTDIIHETREALDPDTSEGWSKNDLITNETRESVFRAFKRKRMNGKMKTQQQRIYKIQLEHLNQAQLLNNGNFDKYKEQANCLITESRSNTSNSTNMPITGTKSVVLPERLSTNSKEEDNIADYHHDDHRHNVDDSFFSSPEPASGNNGDPTKVDFDIEINALQTPNYSCLLCPAKGKFSLSGFIGHRMFHHRRPLKCSECNLYFASPDELEKSPFVFSDDNDGAHKCSKDSLIKVDFHNGNIWSCTVCPERFQLDTVRDAHEESCHPGVNIRERSQKCHLCAKSYRSLSERLLHRALEHPEVNNISCLYCNEIFKFNTQEGIEICNTKGLREHLETHHRVFNYLPKPNYCDFCGASCKSTLELKHHMEEAHGLNCSTAFSCPICYARKPNRQTIYGHIDKHVVAAHRKYKSYICEICGHTVTRIDKNQEAPPISFEEHKFAKHGILPTGKRKFHECTNERCNFKTLETGVLKRHLMKEHKAARPYVCQVCGKGFFTTDFLRRHNEIHQNANLKPFQCEICGNSFAVKNYLYIHMRLSHQNRPFASTHKKKPYRRKPKKGAAPPNDDNNAVVDGDGETGSTISQNAQDLSTEKG